MTLNSSNNLFNRTPFSWFLSTQQIEFIHTSGQTYFHIPVFENIIELNIKDISKKLIEIVPSPSFEKRIYVLAAVLRGADTCRYGWSIKKIIIDDQEFNIKSKYDVEDLRILFEQIESRLDIKKALENKELDLNDPSLNDLLMETLNKNKKLNFTNPPTEQMVNFLVLYHKALSSVPIVLSRTIALAIARPKKEI